MLEIATSPLYDYPPEATPTFCEKICFYTYEGPLLSLVFLVISCVLLVFVIITAIIKKEFRTLLTISSVLLPLTSLYIVINLIRLIPVIGIPLAKPIHPLISYPAIYLYKLRSDNTNNTIDHDPNAPLSEKELALLPKNIRDKIAARPPNTQRKAYAVYFSDRGPR